MAFISNDDRKTPLIAGTSFLRTISSQALTYHNLYDIVKEGSTTIPGVGVECKRTRNGGNPTLGL